MPSPLAEIKRKPDRHAWRVNRQSARIKSIHLWYPGRHAEASELSGLWKKDHAKTRPDLFAHCIVVEADPCKGYYYAKDPVLIETEFAAHVLKWRRDTKHYSSLTKMVLHPSYLRVIGMGRQVLPLLLKELQTRKDHWLVALNAITGEDPASPGSTFQEAVDAWLHWGREKGYLG